MNYAIESDIENNKQGKPGIAKLRILDKVITKLKNPAFAELFLDNDGLNIINKFISRLPDGSWPLSNVRTKILILINGLPCNTDHMRSSELGRTLAILQGSRKELPENKKLIQLIKDKWARIICNINVEYTSLEQCEKTNSLPFTYRLAEEEEMLGKRGDMTEEELNANLSYRNVQRPKSLGYNFTVRPSSVYRPIDAAAGRTEDQIDLDKHLMRIRRSVKRL